MSDNKSSNKSAPKVRVRTGLKSGGPVLQHGVRIRQTSR
jgi:hypothetical protein